MSCPLPALFQWLGLPYDTVLLNWFVYVAIVAAGMFFVFLGWREGTRKMLLVGILIGVVSAIGLWLMARYLLCCCV